MALEMRFSTPRHPLLDEDSAVHLPRILPQFLRHNVKWNSMNASNAQIGDWLGLRSPATESEILRIVEGRLAPSVIKRLSVLGLERAEIDAVVIPSRTLQHRRSRREKLTVEESDRVLRVIRVLSLTESVYGSRERALAWLRRPHPRLDGRTPLSLLKTDAGSRIVEELLIQIDEGMFI
jgi:putative toxin-antitoxin system antitoxin component (TIGR02293 family)